MSFLGYNNKYLVYYIRYLFINSFPSLIISYEILYYMFGDYSKRKKN